MRNTTSTYEGSLAADHDDWVSKTDLVDYSRCPYSFWRRSQRMISFEDTVTRFTLRLIKQGRAFEDDVTAGAVEVPQGILLEGVRAGATGWHVPTLKNEEKRFLGRPDGLKGIDGVLIPIEIKSHKRIQPSDVLELAFYWLLLQPYQERRSRKAQGFLVLRDRDGSGEPHPEMPMLSVEILTQQLDAAQELAEMVRAARVGGVEPRACGCPACKHDPEIMQLVRERRHVSLIFSVGFKLERALADLDVTTLDDLLHSDPLDLASQLRAAGFVGITPQSLEQWRWHAESYLRNEIVFFGERLAVGKEYIVLDAEYDDDFVWLIGAGLARGGQLTRYSPFWADNQRAQREVLCSVLEFVAAAPNLPILTWNGKSADLPTLRRHAERLGLDRGLIDPLVDRHVDALDYTKRSIRFPGPRLGQKEVEAALGIQRLSHQVADGREAILLYDEYKRLGARSAEGKLLQKRLVAYNRDDLRGLILIVERLKGLSANGPSPVPKKPPNAVKEAQMTPLPRTRTTGRIRKTEVEATRRPSLPTLGEDGMVECPQCGRLLYLSAFPVAGRGLCRMCWQVRRIWAARWKQ